MQKLRNISARVRLLALLGLMMFLLFAPMALGQSEPLRYLVAPETPGPNAKVIIQAEGVGGFLGDADIRWSVDGSLKKSGAGERTFSFTTGALGTRMSVRVDIDSPTQGSFSKTFVFSPSLVNMVWEADTTVPPMYRGKALYSAGSPLKIVAFPVVYSGSSRVAAGALTFEWSRNEEPLAASSGLGRSVLSFVGDQLQAQEQVAVDIYYGGAKVARGEIIIPAVDPQIVLYERSALRGPIYELAFPGSISLVAQELTLQAQPFYFSNTSKRAGLLQYNWTLGGSEIAGPDSARGILTLRQAGQGAGETQIEVELQNQSGEQLVQAARAALRILFGQGSNANLFGL